MSSDPYLQIVVDGPYVVGCTYCSILMGLLVFQAYTYFTRFKEDRMTIKALVLIVFLLETLMTACVFYEIWTTAIIESSSTGVTPRIMAPTAGLVTTLTHAFYCWRISSLQKSYLVSLPIMTVSLLQLASLVYLGATNGLFPSNVVVLNDTPSDVAFELSPWLVTWLGSSAACDIAITLCLILILRPSKSSFESSKIILVQLTRLTIETGLVTTAAALLELTLGIIYQRYLYHITVFYVVSKLYANCLLASLNFRLVLRNQSHPNVTTIVWTNPASDAQLRQTVSRVSRVAHILARAETEVNVIVDLNETSSGKKSYVEDEMSEMYELSDASSVGLR